MSDHEDVDYDEEGMEQAEPAVSSPARKPTDSAAAAGGSAVKTKGRGHRSSTTGEESAHRGGHYEEIDHEGGGGGGRGEPAKSIEGWVVVVTGVHEEAQEEEVVDRFAEFGDVKNIQMNLDRRTGFVKGYAFIEYGSKKEAETAIKEMDGESLYDKKVSVDWAFVKGGGGRGGGGGGGRR